MMIRENRVVWKNGSLSTEGLFYRGRSKRGVVICHPHPQMGGSMHNNVVETVGRAFARMEDSTLRFNFRGVGESTGYYDEGRGEANDVLNACGFLKNQGVDQIVVAGYSFGAWVCLNLLKEDQPDMDVVIFISPPDKYLPFDWTGLKHAPDLMICGNEDPFCDLPTLEKIAKKHSVRLAVIQGGDHFYSNKETQLDEILTQNLS